MTFFALRTSHEIANNSRHEIHKLNIKLLFGINYYAAITFKDEYVKRGIILLFSPILILMFDSLMIFYRPFENYLPDQLVIFMVQYENLRKISEIIFETVPQTILQISLFFVCAEKICGFNAEEEVSMY